MAIYHFSAKVIGRSAGRSAVASAAYRAAERLHDERLDRDHDYSAKAGVVHSEILLPERGAGAVSGIAAVLEQHGAMLQRLLETSTAAPAEETRLHELILALIGRLDAQSGVLGRLEAGFGRSAPRWTGAWRPRRQAYLNARVRDSRTCAETGLSHLSFAKLGKEACQERVAQGGAIELAFQ